MGAYSERPDIKLITMKRETIETALNLFGWHVMYLTLRSRGYETLFERDQFMVSLRPDHPPTVPGWKLAAYDALFREDES